MHHRRHVACIDDTQLDRHLIRRDKSRPHPRHDGRPERLISSSKRRWQGLKRKKEIQGGLGLGYGGESGVWGQRGCRLQSSEYLGGLARRVAGDLTAGGSEIEVRSRYLHLLRGELGVLKAESIGNRLHSRLLRLQLASIKRENRA